MALYWCNCRKPIHYACPSDLEVSAIILRSRIASPLFSLTLIARAMNLLQDIWKGGISAKMSNQRFQSNVVTQPCFFFLFLLSALLSSHQDHSQVTHCETVLFRKHSGYAFFPSGQLDWGLKGICLKLY